MEWKERYEHAHAKLMDDTSVCSENRDLFRRFFEWQAYKLKRINRLPSLDDGTCKTLLYYVSRLRTVNRWFNNKPWIHLTREDIKRVYDDVEDGRIRTLNGKRPFRDKDTYFRRILRGKPFEMAGKQALAREVMEFYTPERKADVRFIRESDFRQLLAVVPQIRHKAYLWLSWDIGENVSSVLQLRKRDFSRTVNTETGEPEYSVILRREILKRSRTSRTEYTNYPETVRHLDLLLAECGDNDLLFPFGPRMARKVLERAGNITGVVCQPNCERITLKDLRSSMACDLLGKGWTTDEVNQRLGHKPSSREIDKYVNWLALDRTKPRKKMQAAQVQGLQEEIRALRDKEQLAQQRHRNLQEQIDALRARIERENRLVYEQVARLVEFSPVRVDA